MKIRRSGEMARRLRFFKEQMLKAGVSPKYSTTPVDVNIDDLEVCEHACGQSWYPLSILFYKLTSGMSCNRLNLPKLSQS